MLMDVFGTCADYEMIDTSKTSFFLFSFKEKQQFLVIFVPIKMQSLFAFDLKPGLMAQHCRFLGLERDFLMGSTV